MVAEHCAVRPEPVRAPLPPLRRATDWTPFEHPAFASAVGAALDHVIDTAAAEGTTPSLGYAETEALCRLFLVHFIALGGRL